MYLRGARVDSVLRFAEDVLGLQRLFVPKTAVSGSARGIIEGNSADSLRSALLRLASKMVDRCGAGNVHQLIGQLCSDERAGWDGADIRSAVAVSTDLRLLGEAKRWFTMDSVTDGAMYRRARKVLSVATNGVSAREIYQAMANDSRWLHENGREFTIPPPSVIEDALLLLPYIGRTAKGGLYLRPNAPDDGLTEAERDVVSSLMARGNVATAEDIVQDCRKSGRKTQSTQALLSQTPVLRSIAPGAFVLRGTYPAPYRVSEVFRSMAESNVDHSLKGVAGKRRKLVVRPEKV